MNKERTRIYGPLQVSRHEPVGLVNSDSAFMRNVCTSFGPVDLFRYKYVNVTPEGNVLRKLRIDKDLMIYPHHVKTFGILNRMSTYIRRKRIRLPDDEVYILCFDFWSNSIFHWMCDAMPRLEAIKHLTNECILLLPDFYKYEYIHETLKAFRFKGIRYFSDNEYLHCAQLIAPEQIAVSGQIRPDNFRSLRSTLLDYFRPSFEGIKYERVYISRRKAKYRTVINEDQLLPLLDKFGFTVICFEDLSVSRQVEVCNRARIVVSIHGANLTNTVFMEENGKVVELRKKNDQLNNYFYEIADAIGCQYYYLDCEFTDPVPGKNFFSLTVDVEAFQKALEYVCTG